MQKTLSLLLILTQVTSPLAFAARSKRPSKEPVKGTVMESTPSEEEDNESVSYGADTQIAPGFLIALSSPQDQRLNGTFRVGSDGKLDLPYNVILKVSGMSLARLKGELERSYKPYFKGAPAISASVKQARYWVEVRGMVEKPGTYLVKKATPLDEIISLAGGLDPDLGSSGYVRIDQGTKVNWVDLSDYYRRGKLKDVPHWIGSDRIFFQKEKPDGFSTAIDESLRKVQIVGEVKTPGELTYRRDADFYYYLIKSGGPTPTADLEHIELVRWDSERKLRESKAIGSMDDIREIREGDILVVHPQSPGRFERTLTIMSVITGMVTASILAVIAIQGANK